MTDFFTRLRERKLVQWALAYVAASFALIQVLDIVAQRFGWPEQAIRFTIIAVCVGFFVVLVLAWYHGERGVQRVNGTELLILALLLAIGGLALWQFGPRNTTAAEGGHAAATPIRNRSRCCHSSNMSGEKGQRLFLRRHQRGNPERARRHSGTARRGAHLVVFLPRRQARSARHRAGTARAPAARRQRAQAGRSRAHHRAADRCEQRLSLVVADVRSRSEGHLRDPG